MTIKLIGECHVRDLKLLTNDPDARFAVHRGNEVGTRLVTRTELLEFLEMCNIEPDSTAAAAVEAGRLKLTAPRCVSCASTLRTDTPASSLSNMVARARKQRHRIVMLHGFIKKSEHTPRREREMAETRMKEIKHANA